MMRKIFLSILKKEKGVLKNTLFVFSTGVISAFLSTTSNIVFSRFFGPEGFGVFKIALSLAATLAYTLDFGAKYFITRYVSEFENKKEPENISHLIERTLMFKTMIAVFILIVSWFFSKQIAQTFFQSQSQIVLVRLTMLLFTIIFLDITIPILLGYQHFKLMALTFILVPFFHMVFGIPLAYVFGIQGSLLGAALAFAVGAIPAIRFILKKVGKRSKIRSFSYKSGFVNYSLPAYFANIPTYVTIIIIPILSLFFSQRQVGFYSFSLSFFTAGQLLPVSLGNVIFPKIARLKSENKESDGFETLKRVALIYTPAVIIGSILSIFLVKPGIAFIAPSFLEASRIVTIQIIASLLLGFFTIGINFVVATNRLKLATILNWVVSAIFVILAIYLTTQIR